MRSALHTIGMLLLCLGLSSSLGACSSFSPEEPPIADSTFIEVLAELHLAAARLEIYPDSSLTSLRDSIFTHYGVPRSQFERALRYYSEHPTAYKAIYEAMQDSLAAEQTRLRGSGQP